MNITLSDFLVQGESFLQIQKAISTGRLAHAYIVCGGEGVGKRTFVKCLTQVLLCNSHSDHAEACGVCENCVQVQTDNHPDIITISPGKPIASSVKSEKSNIPVDDIRQMIRLCNTYSYKGGKKIVVIEQSEKMTIQAENCLLKTLEDPPEDVYFFLLTSDPDILLPTIKSRCRLLQIHPWEDNTLHVILKQRCINLNDDEIKEAIYFAGGSIGKALSIAEDKNYWKLREYVINNIFNITNRTEIILQASAIKQKKSELERILDMTESILQYILYASEADFHLRISQELDLYWNEMIKDRPIELICQLLDEIRECRKMRQYSVNSTAVYEKLLNSFLEVRERWRKLQA